MDLIDRTLLNEVQTRFPVTARPYQVLGEIAEVTEQDAFQRVQRLCQEGIIRRLGGVFDSHRLGYYSTLCAAKVPEAKITALAELLREVPGVTHNYLRNHDYNMWFTLIARSKEAVEHILDKIRTATGITEIYSLPAVRLYKISVNFDMTPEAEEGEKEQEQVGQINMQVQGPDLDDEGNQDEESLNEALAYPLSEADIALIRVLQGNLPDSTRPFAKLAEKLEWQENDVVERVNQLMKGKIIRRFGAVLRHQKAGFVANAMGVWQVDPMRAAEVGEAMARYKEVSHCYQRPTLPDWPFNLFTMVHGRTVEDCEKVMQELSAATGIKDYSMLFSTAELKKSSMQYFLEHEINEFNG